MAGNWFVTVLPKNGPSRYGFTLDKVWYYSRQGFRSSVIR